MLTIIQAPNPVLSEKTRKINRIDKRIRNLIRDMSYTLENTTDPEGVGLAAPQIGESLQLFVIKESPKSPLRVFINPKIYSVSEQKYPVTDKQRPSKSKRSSGENKGVKLEGCLSLKDIWGIVHRGAEVDVAYQDEKGIQQRRIFTGFLATIIQHECDHLQGILFPKRVLEQNEKLYKSITDENGETVFEEISI